MDLGGEFGPAAAGIEAGVGADGTKDAVGGDFYFAGTFDDEVEGAVKIFAALAEQAGGGGVARDGAIVGDPVVVSDLRRDAPVEKFFFDGFAIGMMANDATASVTIKGFELQPLELGEFSGLFGFAGVGDSLCDCHFRFPFFEICAFRRTRARVVRGESVSSGAKARPHKVLNVGALRNSGQAEAPTP
ncbi:MAG: hypothetical protein ACRD59_03460 [Candidatus Acidiferrales bacterium]